MVGVSPGLIVGITLLVVIAGALNGLAGFGFAVVATMSLATVVDPAVAVVFMIGPILAVNIALVRDLSAEEINDCARRFWPLLVTALTGAIAGLLVLDRLPAEPLQVGLGLVTLTFVLTIQNRVRVPGLARAKEGCFVESPSAMAGFGAVSGILLGATNVGVQFVAYLRSCGLRHGLFVGVVAMLFLGLNLIRIAIAGLLGLYPSLAVALASLAGTVPAVIGVGIGKRLRSRFDERQRQFLVLALLSVIGIRLILGGVGIL